MKSRCCTFYKNTSESTSLCKLDTDSSPSPAVPAAASLDSQHPEHTWPSAHPGWVSPRARGEAGGHLPFGQCHLLSLPKLEVCPCSAAHPVPLLQPGC